MTRLFIFGIFFPPEHEEIHAEHVERRQTGNHGHPCAVEPMTVVHCGEHFVFREEAREGEYTCYGKTSDKECPVAYRHIFTQAAHLGVVVGVNRMDQTSGAEEEESLEHCVSKEVEHTGHITEA